MVAKLVRVMLVTIVMIDESFNFALLPSAGIHNKCVILHSTVCMLSCHCSAAMVAGQACASRLGGC